MGKIYSRLIALCISMLLTLALQAQINFSFTVDPSPCRPYTVHFNNATIGATSYKWTFDDGTTSTVTNPVHLYAHGSRYSVALEAWNGGTYMGARYQEVKLMGGPNRIETDKDTVCPGDGVYFYLQGNSFNNRYDFGEGDPIKEGENNHIFKSAGTKTIKAFFDVPGCGPDTLVRTIVVSNTAKPSANFWFPMNACPNEQIQFGVNNSYPTYSWNFGDGQSSTEQRPMHSYPTTGTKTITLDVTNACGMSNSRSQTINIVNNKKWNQYELSMWVSNDHPCPGERVKFNYCCNAPYFMAWIFGDGDSIANVPYPEHQYMANGTYTAKLRARNACGNDTVISHTIIVGTPPYFGGSPKLISSADSICPGEGMGFEINDLMYSDGMQMFWNFGDGATENSNSTRRNHEYNSIGIKNVSVKISNTCGKDTTLYRTIKISNNVLPTLMAGKNWGSPTSSACPNDSVLFYAQGGTAYLWEFGDGVSTTMTVPVQTGDGTVDVAGHVFHAKADYKVRLTYYNKCNKSAKDSMIFPVVDNAIPSGDFDIVYPSNKMGAYMTCQPVKFMAYGGSSYRFYYGDGDSLITSDMYSYHQYKTEGNFNVTVKIFNNCGKSITSSKSVNVVKNFLGVAGHDPGDTTAKACPGDTVTFYATLGGTNYNFAFGDGTNTTNVIPFTSPDMGMEFVLARHPYTAIGNYKVKVSYTNYCGNVVKDSFIFKVGNTGIKPQIDFLIKTDYDSRSVCTPITFNGFGAATYKWYFGDGDSLITTNSEVTHKYKSQGNYNISMIGTNGCGMKDTISSDPMKGTSIQIKRPDIGVTDSASCAGDSIIFYANAGTNYLWKFGDGQQGTQMSDLVTPGGTVKIIKHAYEANGTYKTIVSYTNGCSLAAKDSFMVNVTGSRPVIGKLDIWSDGKGSGDPACKPIQMMATGGKIYKWHFGDGDSLNTTDAFVSHAYSAAGNFQISVKVINGCGNSATFTSTEIINAMAVMGTVNHPLCNVQASGSVSLSVLGGTAPYTYTWNNNDTAKHPVNMLAGNYSVTVKDFYGCEVNKSFTLTDPTPVTMTSTITNAGCGLSDGGASVTPSGGNSASYSYLWSTGETVSSISAKAAGVYNVTIKDANQCAKSFSVAINNASAPAVTLGNFADLCANANSITLSGGAPAGGTYKVDGTIATIFDPKISGPGTHSITYSYTDGSNCTGTIVKSLIVNPVPNVSLGAYDPICKNEPVITFDKGYPAGGTYKLDGSAAVSLNPATATAGSHTLVYDYTDGKGCAATASQTLDVRAVTAPTLAAFNPVCTTSPVLTLTGGAPAGGTYQLEGINASIMNPVLFAPGTYNIKYTYSNNGCTESVSKTIAVKAAVAVTGTATNAACNTEASGAVNITVTGGSTPYTYAWNNSATTQNISSIAAGNYSVNITDAYGCTGTKSFTVTEPTAIVANPSSTLTSSCGVSDGTATVAPTGGTPGYTYLWSPGGATTATITGKAAGVYNVTIKDANNCTKSVAISITEPGAPIVTLSDFADMCSNDASMTLSGGLPAGGTYKVNGSAATTFNPKVLGAGTYNITYTAVSGGCSASQAKTLLVKAAPTATLPVDQSVCKNAAVIVFNYGAPAGGAYKLDGSSAASLNPALIAAGTHELIYSNTANGCTASDTQLITVKSVTAASLSAFANICSNNALLTLSGGLPAGGTYQINGSTATTFNPVTSTPGTFNVSYIYTNNGCSDTAKQTLVLNAAPTVTMTAFAAMCKNAANHNLTAGSPAGGTYYIDGTVAAAINPANLTAASHTVTYIYTSNGCPDTATQSVVINAVTSASLPAFAGVCSSASAITLNTGAPAGGIYQVDGTTATTFDPSVATAGTHNIHYLYTASGCTDTAKQTIVVTAKPTVTLAAIPTLCSNVGILTLAGASPAGGTFKINDSVATTFDPTKHAAGNYTVKYIYTTGACKDSVSKSLKFAIAPKATLAAFDSICNNATALTLSGGLPAGGKYTIDGTVATAFTPSTGGLHNIFYIFTDTNTCADTAKQTIFVKTCVDINVTSIAGLEVYPNPTSGILNVNLTTSASRVTMKLVNAVGQILLVENVENKDIIRKTMNLESYPAGIYTLVIIANDEVTTSTIFIAE